MAGLPAAAGRAGAPAVTEGAPACTLGAGACAIVPAGGTCGCATGGAIGAGCPAGSSAHAESPHAATIATIRFMLFLMTPSKHTTTEGLRRRLRLADADAYGRAEQDAHLARVELVAEA